MSISIAKLIREFTYNGVAFVDPGPSFSPEAPGAGPASHRPRRRNEPG